AARERRNEQLEPRQLDEAAHCCPRRLIDHEDEAEAALLRSDGRAEERLDIRGGEECRPGEVYDDVEARLEHGAQLLLEPQQRVEIGRASCRERVECQVSGGSVKKGSKN